MNFPALMAQTVRCGSQTASGTKQSGIGPIRTGTRREEPRPAASSPSTGEDAMLRVCNAVGDIDSATAPHFNADLRRVIDKSDEAVRC